MIDSITLSFSDFILYSDEFFTKAKFQELKGKHGVFARHSTRYTDYPQRCKTDGRYFPQVHITATEHRWSGRFCVRPSSRRLIVQVSLPKLLYSVSIFDIDERLLPLVAQRLVDVLKEIKLGVTAEGVLNAIVQRVDYSKILKISPSFGTTARILRELAPYDLKQSSDFNRSHYHDGKDGFYLKFYNSSRGFVLYDKFDELLTNGKTKLEQEISRQYVAGKWKSGALRIELSLQKKQTVEAALRRLIRTKKKDFTLREAANAKIAKTLLLETFAQVYIKNFNRLVRLTGLKDAEILAIVNAKAVDFKERAALYYLVHRVRDVGLRAAIEELKLDASPATVGRYKTAVERVLGEADAKKDSVDVVGYLRRKLEAFTPVLPKRLVKSLGNVAESKGMV
jgi:hypothetical protein